MSLTFSLSRPFARLSPNPVDSSLIFPTFAALTAYANTNPIAYRGQILAVSGTNTPYIISDQLSALPIALQSYVQSYAGGAFLPLSGGFVTGNIISNSAISANEIDVDNIQIEGNTISITNPANGDLTLSPNGTGEVNISKVDIDSGTIDGVTIGGTTAAISVSTALLNVDNIRVDGNVISSTNTGGDISLQPNSNTTTATGNLSASGTVTGNIVNATTGFKINNANATAGNVLRGNGTNFVASTLAASDIASGQALTTISDSNIILALTGGPSAALLSAVTLSAGWFGQLPISRGGTGSSTGSINAPGALTFTAGGTNDINLSTTAPGKVVIGNADINGGTIDGTSIGFTAAASGVFTGIRTSGDVSIGGNLFVEGSSAFVNTNNLIVNDPIIFLAEGNPGDTVDIGFTGAYNHPSLPRHTGLVRDASSGGTGEWTLFSGLTSEVLSATQIPFNDPSLVIDTLRANIRGTLTGNVSGAALSAVQANRFTTGRIISATGDISYSSGLFDGSTNVTGTATIGTNRVDYTKIQTVAANKILGNPTGSTANVSEIDCTTSGRRLLSATSATDQRNSLELGSSNTVTFGEVIVNNGVKAVASDVYHNTGTNPITVSTFPDAMYQSAKYTVLITRTDNNNRCALEILAVKNVVASVATWHGTVYGIVDPSGIFQDVNIVVPSTTVDLTFQLIGAVNHSITVYAQALSA